MQKKVHPAEALSAKQAEKFIIKKLKLESADKTDFFEAKVNLDGQNKNGFFEIYACGDKLKPGQEKKVMNDAVKLFLAAKHNKKRNKTIIFTSKSAESHFKKNTWRSIALRELGIKTKSIQLHLGLQRQLQREKAKNARAINRKAVVFKK